GSPWRRGNPPLKELRPARLVPVVLEDVQHPAGPLLTRFIVVAIDLAPGLVHVLAEVVEVQPQGVQRQALPLDLVADPRRAIDVAHLLVGPVEVDPAGFPAHQPPGHLAIAPRAADQPVVLGLVVEGDDLELLVLLVDARLPRRQRSPLPPPPPPLPLHLPPPPPLLA